jgi:hypothetical protein
MLICVGIHNTSTVWIRKNILLGKIRRLESRLGEGNYVNSYYSRQVYLRATFQEKNVSS